MPTAPTSSGVADPFLWLEPDTTAALEWQDEQDARTTAHLEGWPHRPALAALLETLPPSRGGHVPRRAGPVWFRVDGGSLTADGVVLMEPNAGGETVREFWPSPDGRHVAAATAIGSAETGELRLIDVESRAEVGQRLLFTAWSRLSWLPDSSGFYMNGFDIRAGAPTGVVWFRSIDEPHASALNLPDEGPDLYPEVSVDGTRVVISRGVGALRPAWLVDRSSDAVRSFIDDVASHAHGVVVGDRYVAVTTVGADRGRLVGIPLATAPDVTTWRELIPEGDAVMRAVSVVGDRVVLSELVDGCSRFRVARLDGSDLTTVPMPNDGVGVASAASPPLPGVASFYVVPGSDTLSFGFSSPASPPSPWACSLRTGDLSVLSPPVGAVPARSRLVTCAAADGTSLSAWVTEPAPAAEGEALPALVLVYGGWNLPNSPQYSPATAAFVASGGAVVHAIVRGGGERGDSWWRSGRREAKQTTFDDLYAIVEHLVASGTIDGSRVALQGGSAGGLAAAVAATQRPDLFAAVVATAPLLDLRRVADGPGTAEATIASITEELGDDHAVLGAYSPYDRVHPDLPAMFVGATADDIRAPAWHARKFVARAREAGTRHPVLLRVWKGAGHGTGLPPGNLITRDWLAFVMERLGVTPASVPAAAELAG